ncbi:MAG: hypothetical protein HZA15_14400 [Nitrospirae bacterium]|nr:hypothetical protein [Nitrospirota bacterium]
MFQPRVKLAFVTRYCPPESGWKVFVDIDASEEGRTGGERSNKQAQERQRDMQQDAAVVRTALANLGVTIGGNRGAWFNANGFPAIEGDRDIIAFHRQVKRCLIAEVEGISSGQPEQKLYKAIGQIVMAAGTPPLKDWQLCLVLAVHGKQIADHLARATALNKLGISAVSITDKKENDLWLFDGAGIFLNKARNEPL